MKTEFAAVGLDGACIEMGHPSRLAEWLAAIGVRPVHPLPDDWNDLVLFGCDVEVCDGNNVAL